MNEGISTFSDSAIRKSFWTPNNPSLPLSNCSFKKGSSQMGWVREGVQLLFCSHLKRCCLVWGPGEKSERRGPFTIACGGAPICSPPWRCCPRMLAWSQGGRWGVFHWDGGQWERSQVPTRVWWALDAMNLKGQWDIWAEQTHKPRDTVLMNGSWINVQEMLTCSQIACPGTDFLQCYCPIDQGFHRFHS